MAKAPDSQNDDFEPRHSSRGLSLFWRTFILVCALLLASMIAWLQTFDALSQEPREAATATQAANLVALAQSALRSSDPIHRLAMIQDFREKHRLRVLPKEPKDSLQNCTESDGHKRVAALMASRLGPQTIIACAVNNVAGYWVGFNIGQDNYWFIFEPHEAGLTDTASWTLWAMAAALLSLLGAAAISRLINQPLKKLSFATSLLRAGDYTASRLDESALTSEIRQVNVGFNRMAEQLAKVEQDRAVMLAGISHDLRTPLARLRLELEMSVPDDQAREHMANDIDQLDAVIDKFLEYAKPGNTTLQPVNVLEVLKSCLAQEQHKPGLNVALRIDPQHIVLADRVDLLRVVNNLVENARKYGASANGETYLEINAMAVQDVIYIRFRDYGKGVPSAMLSMLTQPFFRGDTARTHASGAGLGLAITDKIVKRMGGHLQMTNADEGGFVVRIRLTRAQIQSGLVSTGDSLNHS